jgi:hypothetical protein
MYLGRISRGAFAAAVDNVTVIDGHCRFPESDRGRALSAEVIGYKCIQRPGPCEKYRRSADHNANYNHIEGAVRCWIVNSYAPLTDT